MLNIAFEVTSLAVSPYGGIAQVCYHTLRMAASHPDLRPTALYRRGDPNNVKVQNIPVQQTGLLSRFRSPRYDIVHALCHRLPSVRSEKVIYTTHDVWSLYPNTYQPAPFQKKLEARMRKDIFRSDLIIADSEWTRRKLLELDLVAPDKCVAVPLGVSVPSIPTDADISAPVRPVLSQSYVLFVGRIENRKNLGHIVDAVMPLKNLTLVIVGEPGFGYDDIAVRDLARFPSERLIQFSRLTQADLTALYQHATATLLPSWEEGFGMPVLEAMAAGSPVITSNLSSCAEVAGDAGVLVSPVEPSASTEALRRLLDDQSYRHALIDAGTHRAREFTWERYGETLTQMYARVMAEG